MATPAPVYRQSVAMDVTILDTESLSSALHLRGRVVVGIYIPASWTTGNITFQACDTEDGTFVDVYTLTAELAATSAASSRYVALDPVNFHGINFLKIRSGTSGTPVAQSGDITLQLMLAVPDR